MKPVSVEPGLAQMALVLAICSLVGGTETAAADTRVCEPSARGTVVATATARVYRSHGVLYGCLYRRPSRVLRLGRYGSDSYSRLGHRNIRLAGHYVAYNRFVLDKTATEVVFVVDLRTGVEKQDAVTGGPPAGQNIGIGPTTALVLHPTGSVAWIVKDRNSPTPRYEVHIADGTRRRNTGSRVLDQGPLLDPTSLAASAHTLYWQNAGQTHSAPFS